MKCKVRAGLRYAFNCSTSARRVLLSHIDFSIVRTGYFRLDLAGGARGRSVLLMFRIV